MDVIFKVPRKTKSNRTDNSKEAKQTARRDQDTSLKYLFSHPKVVADLLRGFVPDSWVEDLDFSKLQRKNVRHSSANTVSRESDILWQLPFRDETFYVLFLLELQSSIEPFMALRILTYVGLILEDIVKQDALKGGDGLPTIFPLVFYTGEKPWGAPLALKACFDNNAPKELQKYRPNIQYFLLDIGRIVFNEEKLASTNVISHLIQMEQAKELSELLEKVKQAISTFKGTAEGKALLRYILQASKVSKRFSDNELELMREDESMLAEKITKWEEDLYQKGKEEGSAEAQREERLSFLALLLAKRLGELPKPMQKKIYGASSEQLQLWISQLMNEEMVPELNS